MTVRLPRTVLLLLALTTIGCGESPGTQGEATSKRIYYIPFSMVTAFPITPDTIDRFAKCTLDVALEETEEARLRGLLTPATPVAWFSSWQTRLRIDGLESRSVFVDATGSLRLGWKWSGRVSPEALAELQTFLDLLCTKYGHPPATPRRLLEPIGKVPPTELESMSYEARKSQTKVAGLN